MSINYNHTNNFLSNMIKGMEKIDSKKFSNILVELKGVDFYGGDVKYIKVKDYHEAISHVKDWVIDGLRSATLYKNDLYLKDTRYTNPGKSDINQHNKCTSFIKGEEVPRIMQIISVENIEISGVEIREIHVDSYEEAVEETKSWITASNKCATYTGDSILLKEFSIDDNAGPVVSGKDNCVSFLYGKSIPKYSEMIIIRQLDMFGADKECLEVKNLEEAIEKSREWVNVHSRCATLHKNKLYLKNIIFTNPSNSVYTVHSECISFFYGHKIAK